MQIHDIPFVRLTGIEITPAGRLIQPFSDDVVNHLGTMHAGVQFALAETASGFYLQTQFGEVADRVIPVLRRAEMKYRQPVTSTISAHPAAKPEQLAVFQERLERKGRASIDVAVTLRSEKDIVAEGIFGWFISVADGRTL